MWWKDINIIETIKTIMATTITIHEGTKARLADYKLGDWTFDDILNMLMDRVRIEDISAEHIKEHYRRLSDFQGVSNEKLKKRLAKKLRSDG
jgi:hypothetical protein